MSAPDALAAALATGGASSCFGVPGGGPNLDVIGAAEDAGVGFVLAHGETAACIMAAVHGRLVGRTAMALVTRGPGVTSAVNGVAQATLDRYPLLLVSDCVPAADAARVAHQRLDQASVLRPVTKWQGVLGGGTADATAAGALALAAAPRPGAVHLDLDGSRPSSPVPAALPPPWPGPDARATATRLLSAARRPVALVGLGALDDPDATRAALERAACPVLTTYQAIGILPEGHPQWAGLFTSGVIERPLLDQADLVLAIGFDEVEPMPPPWSYDVPIVSLARVEPVSTFLPVTVPLVGELAPLLDELVPSLDHDWAGDAGASALAEARGMLRRHTSNFGPIELVDALVAGAPADAIVTVDAGAHFLAVLPLWPVRAPLELLISNGLATMGFALPAAIGASLARPGRPVLCCVGDGGLGMTLAELETVARLGLPITIVVFDDAALSLIEIKQGERHGGRNAVRYAPVDFAAIAAAMGIEHRVAASPGEVAAALERPQAAPRLIDARIDPGPYRGLIRTTRG